MGVGNHCFVLFLQMVVGVDREGDSLLAIGFTTLTKELPRLSRRVFERELAHGSIYLGQRCRFYRPVCTHATVPFRPVHGS